MRSPSPVLKYCARWYSGKQSKVPEYAKLSNDFLLTDLDNTRFIDAIAEELNGAFDRLDLRENYGLLVIPGYLGSNKVVEKWAKIAHENKVMMVTDFAHLDEPDDVMEMFEGANLTSGDMFKSNVMVSLSVIIFEISALGIVFGSVVNVMIPINSPVTTFTPSPKS